MNMRLSLVEIFLIELVVWLALWLTSDYVATLLTIIVSIIVCAVLVLSLVSEWIEKSKVPRSYFSIMALSVLASLVAAGIFYLIHQNS
jgi:hypothetical protein